MAIRVYNTLSKNKEPLETVAPGKVGIYLCGPTVYKPSHIGHMVGPVIFDVVKRYLTYCGYQVTWVVNITDVDDKLIVESQRRNMAMKDLAEEMTVDYMRNLAAMGVDTIDHFPRATDHIDDILQITRRLIERGYAYESDGDVFFDVGKDAEYGKLSRRSVESMQGEGGTAAERKRNVADFALWKKAKPGEPAWPSPWGSGRPGWHIECSAMSHKLLGETFDIHGGGLDLVFPHHENEIAQSECCHGKPQARYWMHNGLMQASDEVGKVGGRNTRPTEGDQAAQEAGKIGKSKGAQAFSELLQQFDGETIRFFLISSHYRRPIDYSEERIREVGAGLETFYRLFERCQRITGESFYAIECAHRREEGGPKPGHALSDTLATHRNRFLEFMDDDFNTGGAIGELFELARGLNRFIEAEKLELAGVRGGAGGADKVAALIDGQRVLREIAAVLGLFRSPPQKKSAADDSLVGSLLDLFVQLRADVRTEAKQSKNKQLFALADKIRDQLAALGVTLEDRSDGTSWTLKN